MIFECVYFLSFQRHLITEIINHYVWIILSILSFNKLLGTEWCLCYDTVGGQIIS